jgi:hypothetical protein
MSRYAYGAEPACPVKSPLCTGTIASRGSKQCVGCRKFQQNSERAKIVASSPAERVVADRKENVLREGLSNLQRKYNESLKRIDALEHQLTASNVLSSVDTYTIRPHQGQGTSEATPVIVASDWHIEERVRAETVSGLNSFSLDEGKARVMKFFQSSLRLIQLLNQDVQINDVVLALLGDFITNDIHEELKDLNQLQPINALALAQEHIVSGIEFLLANSKYNFIVPCHSGNHARTTKQTYFSSENGHSLEYLMYLHLAAYFRGESRVKFIIPEGYHSYLKVYDQTIRFHHGHAVKYGGGVGGIFIPTYKAISQWNKARAASLDVFGHFHQMKDGGNFLCNGSLIGYNAFAVAIKADYEPPRQTLFLIDKKRGRTCTWPILLK